MLDLIQKFKVAAERLMLAACPLPRPAPPPLHHRVYHAARSRLLRARRAIRHVPDRAGPAMARSDSDRTRFLQIQTEAQAYFSESNRRSLLEIAGSSATTGADLTDYYLLHRYVVSKRPSRILEFGSGVTTVFLAHALHEIARREPASRGHVWSLEDVPNWHERARELCPAELQSYVTYLLSEKREAVWGGYVWGFGYESVPKGPVDFVFVDGPTEKRGTFAGANIDIFDVIAQSGNSFDAMIDFRWPTCVSLARFLPPRCIAFDYALGVGLLRGLSRDALARRPAFPRRLRGADAFEWFGI